MKKRFAILLLILLGAVVAGLLVSRLWHREPRCQGQPLSYWLREYARHGAYSYPNQQGDARGERALEALCAIGTNAVPYLVSMCLSTNQDSPLATNLVSTLGKLGFAPFVSNDQLGTAAYEALCQIRPPAQILLPYLSAALSETNSPRRLYALYALGATGEGAEAAVPFLGAALKDATTLEPYYAVLAIGRIGPPARVLLPDLVAIIESPQTVAALRSYAASALARMGTNAAGAAPALLAMLAESSLQNRQAAATALNAIGYDRRSLLAEMARQLEGPDEGMRYNMARIILDLESTNSAAMSAMLGFAQADSGWRVMAIQELGRLGSAAAPVIPVLREALTSTNLTVREAARRAVQQIEAATATNRNIAR
jgi:HEAT repeat protein